MANQIENQIIEYKSDIPKKHNDLKAEIVAFLNSNDGIIHLGVTDDGVAILEKRKFFKEWEELISNWIHSAFNTPVQDFVKINVTNEEFSIHIKQGKEPPYFYKDGEALNAKGVYLRKGSSKRRATSEELVRMIKKQVAHEFESQPISHVEKLTFKYLSDILLNTDIQFDTKGLRLENKNGDYTNGALILSDQNPYVTKIAVVDGVDMSADFLAKKKLSGSLVKQIDMTLEYISLLNDKKVSFTGAPARIEFEAYPSKAIREAIINAYAHRDYSLSADIKVEIYDNRMEIFSAGGLPEGLSIDDIKQGISASRNPNLVHVLDKINYIENYATGIRRIIASYNDFDNKPEFIVTPNQFKVVLYNKHYFQNEGVEVKNPIDSFSKYNLSDGEQLELGFIDSGEALNHEEVLTIDTVEPELDNSDEKIIKVLRLNEELSRKKIQEYTKESKSRTHQRLTRLIDLGFLDKKGQSRSVVYFLNDTKKP